MLAITEPMLVTDWRIDAQRLRVDALFKLGRFQEVVNATSEVINAEPKNARA